LHPAAGHGVRRVSGGGFPILDLASQIVAGGPTPSSRRTSHPPKASSTAAVPRHRGRCPLAVGRRSCSAPRPTLLPAPSAELHRAGASTSRRCSAVESGHPTIVADRLASCPSMGFVPLRGPSERTRHSCRRSQCCRRRKSEEKRAYQQQAPFRIHSVRTLQTRADSLAEVEHGGDTSHRSEDRTAATWPRHRRRSEERHQPGCINLPEGSSTPRTESVSRPKTSAVEYSMRSESLLRFTGERPEADPPEPDRSQDPGRRDRGRSHGHEPVPKKSIQS
jgi:hypothetical protein